jgi:SSS family solute:Na+ symporter
LIIGTIAAVPVWAYFAFVGSALWVFYQNTPSAAVGKMEPEGVFTYFILTQIPVGLTGFVIFGILAAAMSSLDSTLNATAAAMTNDFYKRFESSEKSERHYLEVGRWFTVLISVLMVVVALGIHFLRNDTLLDLMSFALGLITTGLLGILFLAFFTVRIGSRAAIVSLAATGLFVMVWVFLTTDTGERWLPGLANLVPSRFWIAVIPNLLLVGVGFLASLVFPGPSREELRGLTVWTNE